MRTSEQIYHRVRWDPRFDPERFVLGVRQRGAEPKRVPLPAFAPGGDIPWHRVLFIEADGVLVWDRATGIDRVDTSGAGLVRHHGLLPAPFFTPGTPHAFQPGHGWRPAPTPEPGAPGRLRLLTWNTLWDRYDSDRIDTARRRPLLLAALQAADADVIALQEAEPELLALLSTAPWVRAGYTLSAAPDAAAPGGLVLLSRLPVREAGSHRLAPHKAVLAVVVDTAAGPLAVAATHLSSDHSAEGARRRQDELTRLAEGLSDIKADLVLLGDFNDDGAAPTAMLGMDDAWTQVHGPGDVTPTFDPVVNPLAAVSSLSGVARRLDRVLLRGGASAVAAALVGDRPQADGLYPSDHYGVVVDLAFAGAGESDVLDVAPTARTALAWLPPERVWPAVQELRRVHDPQFHRWPPHVNVLFGFVPESDFERAAPLLAAAAAQTPPFPARLRGVHTFGHRDDATIWLDPAADGDAPWIRLWQALRQRFPRCRGRAEGFTPHLSLGRSRDPQRVAAACAARLGESRAQVGELVLLSRRGDEPMRPRAVLALGTGDLRWLPDPAYPQAPIAGPGATLSAAAPGRAASVARGGAARSAAKDDPATAVAEFGPAGSAAEADLASSVVERLAAAFAEGVVHVTGSRWMGCALPGADLDLVAALPGRVDGVDVTARVAAALPDADAVRSVTGARVPRVRLSVRGFDVDLVVVGTGGLDPAEGVARRAELGEEAAVALSAVSDADAVLAAVGSRHAAFALLARQVKGWATAKGLDSAPFGGLPGLAWSVLAARTVLGAPVDAAAEALLQRFFADWAAWDWRQAVALGDAPGGVHPRGTVLTPTAPVRSCAEQLGPGGLDLLGQELYLAWEVLEQASKTGTDPWPVLTEPPPLHRRHASWAVVGVRADDAETLGRVRGRMRALLSLLDEAGATQVHAWPRPFGTGPVTRYAIGLGPAGVDPSLIAAVERWAADLPGVEAALVDNGAVPTLC
ncbi:poly(A) polymerase [Catellatospora sichuanensis]|uniref:poly(A) polymerase n=1 Tax=Catellatospora sichuanensis TaxID=1969805 RepID=UPI001183C9BD|nr:poly(A) polymerase [Catellatospora sichuanensis]